MNELADVLPLPPPNRSGYDRLYKYRRWDQNAKSLLANNEVYFTEPDKFNDPFDCAIEIEFDGGTRGNRLKKFEEYLRGRFPFKSDAEIARLVSKELPPGTRTIGERNRQQFQEKLYSDRNRNTGVLSLTWTFENLLMWSHYSEQHEGLCVGFDVAALREFLLDNLHDQKIHLDAQEVRYVDEYPKQNYFQDDAIEISWNSLLTKSRHWTYEEEYRLLMLSIHASHEGLSKSDRVVHLPDNVIRSVYMGLRMPGEHQMEIMRILKKRNDKIRLYRASRKRGQFALKFEKVVYRK